ncbi:MAG: DUF1987 domain-containing protein [Candidatus Marithrix sp.]
MKNLVIEVTKHTPQITFDIEKDLLEFKGECYPENVASFIAPIFNLLDDYLEQLEKQVFTINISLIYFNSSSSKMLLDLFYKLEEEASTNNKNIVVNWIYDSEDEDSEEYGEEFKEDLEALTFNLIPNEI